MAQKPDADPGSRELNPHERNVIEAARKKAHILYQGERVAHRSCGISLAETFNVPTRPYQALRRGGITGLGPCGSIRAGEHILGELLGDPDPTGGVTQVLRSAMEWYQRQVTTRFARSPEGDYVCNHLTAPHGDFGGAARKGFCTNLTAEVAALTAETLLRFAPALALEITEVKED